METKEQAIHEMCMFYRPDYMVRKLETDPPWIAGLTESDARMLYIVMEKIYQEFIEPLKPFDKKSKRKRRYRR